MSERTVSMQDPIEIKTNKPDEKLWKVKIVANLAVRTVLNVKWLDVSRQVNVG